MRKSLRKTLSLVLCLVLALTIVGPTTLASADNSDLHGITTMGDSVATGYELVQDSWWSSELDVNENGQPVYMKTPVGMHVLVPNSYSGLVATALGINDSNKDSWYYNHTRAGFRTIEETRMLDPEYDAEIGDEVLSNNYILHGHANMNEEQLQQFRDEAATNVANSKLVIVELGMSDIGHAFTLAANLIVDDIAQSANKSVESLQGIADALQSGDLATMLTAGLQAAKYAGVLPAAITAFTKAELQTTAGFALNYKKLMDTIYEINPDCTIVALGMFNPFGDVSLLGLDAVKAGQLYDVAIEMVNQIIKNASPSSDCDYRYVDIMDCPMRGIDGGLLTNPIGVYTGIFNNLHPMEEGHAWIAQQILDTLGSDFSLNLGNAGTPSTGRFVDVNSSDWFYTAVNYVADHNYMVGTTDNTFEPYTNLTRAMVVQILYAIEGWPSSGSNAFSDVPDGEWYTNAVNWAASNSIVAGMGDGTFAPNADVTREQLATILYGYAKYKNADTALSGDVAKFADQGQISDWAVDGLKWAVGHGVIAGKDNNQLDPLGTATRAEMAQMIYRLMTEVL